ncbi:MAG: sodium:proton antiporter [Halobacteriales archaeon]
MTPLILALILGSLFSLGTFLLLRRDLLKAILGVIILGQAANVYLITMGGLSGTVPVLSTSNSSVSITDPLVQALVLTAIVISLGTTAFVLVLLLRVYDEHGTLDIDRLWGQL